MRKLFVCALLISSTAIPTGAAQADASAPSGETQSANAKSSTTRTEGWLETEIEKEHKATEPAESTKPGEVLPTRLQRLIMSSGKLPPIDWSKSGSFVVPGGDLIYGDEGALPPMGVGDYGLPKAFQDEIKSMPDCTTCAPSRFGRQSPSAWDFPP